MVDFLQWFSAPEPYLSWPVVTLSLLAAFLFASVVAIVYVKTHRGLSYSTSFVQSLILGAIVAAILMLAIGNNLARGVGIVGTLAIIRFRSTMKDPRDMIFIFAAIAVGIAAGVRAIEVGVAGTAVFAAVAWVLHLTEFGTRRAFDGLVRFQLPLDPSAEARVREVLQRHCASFVLVALREVSQGAQNEHNYQVRLKDPDARAAFMADLEMVPGVEGAFFYLHEATEEL